MSQHLGSPGSPGASSPVSEYLPFMSSTNPVQYYPSSRPGSPMSSPLMSNGPLVTGGKSSPSGVSPNSLSLAVSTTPGGLTAEQQQMAMIADPLDRLKYFLTTAPANWRHGDIVKRFLLGNNEQISCVYWGNLFYITGTDIVKILHYRFQLMNRPIVNGKKFEEGVFSDLRNLKAGVDATLEEPRSAFLEVLYRNGCIRTQKKQKVFYWYSVPHERLFSDALERDLKREQLSIAQNTFLNRNMMALLGSGQASGPGGTPTMQHMGTPQLGHAVVPCGPMGLYHHAGVAQSCPTLSGDRASMPSLSRTAYPSNLVDEFLQFTNGHVSSSDMDELSAMTGSHAGYKGGDEQNGSPAAASSLVHTTPPMDGFHAQSPYLASMVPSYFVPGGNYNDASAPGGPSNAALIQYYMHQQAQQAQQQQQLHQLHIQQQHIQQATLNSKNANLNGGHQTPWLQNQVSTLAQPSQT